MVFTRVMKFCARSSKLNICAAFSGVRAGVVGLGGPQEKSRDRAKVAARNFEVVNVSPPALRMVAESAKLENAAVEAVDGELGGVGDRHDCHDAGLHRVGYD